MLLFVFCLAWADVVQNDAKPQKAKGLNSVLEFTLGDGSKDELFFSEGVVAIADEKHIFVLDPTNFRIVSFDSKGNTVREFGKQGQGPGEFQGITALAIDQKGRIAVFDSLQKRLNFFNSEGEFLEDIRIEQGIQHVSNPYFLSNGHVIFMSVKTDAQFQMTYDYSLYNPDMEVADKLLSLPLPPTDWSQASQPDFWVDFLKHQFEAISNGYPMGTSIGNNEEFVLAMSNTYKGEFYSQKGQKRLAFSKKYRPKGFTDQAKFNYCEGVWEGLTANAFLAPNLTRAVFEKAAKKSVLPDFLPPLAAMFRLGNGFATISNYDNTSQTGQLEFFDKSGHCVALGVYEGPIDQVFGFEDRIYAVGANEEDSIVVKVYRVNGLP